MNFNNIYIISWFGDNSVVDKRLSFHNNQLQWCLKHNLQPIVFAQNYEQGFFRPSVEYIKHYGNVLKPGQARNILLKHFYDSDEDYAIFADNDIYLYEGSKYGANDTFVSTMRNIDIDQFNHVDSFFPLNPCYSPFTKDLEKHKNTDKESFRMKPGYCQGGFFLLKNLKKHYGKEIYYDKNFVLPNGQMLPAEDQEFPINMIHDNMTVFLCPNIIKKDQGHNNGSTWEPSKKEEWRQQCLNGLSYIAQKYNLPEQKTLAPSSLWLKHLKMRNHKLRDTKVYFKPNTFKELFECK